jgi:hypothetical protein
VIRSEHNTVGATAHSGWDQYLFTYAGTADSLYLQFQISFVEKLNCLGELWMVGHSESRG